MLEKVGCRTGQVRVPWMHALCEQKEPPPQSVSMAHCAGETPPTQPAAPSTAMRTRGPMQPAIVAGFNSWRSEPAGAQHDPDPRLLELGGPLDSASDAQLESVADPDADERASGERE